jgi:hypothetical protein
VLPLGPDVCEVSAHELIFGELLIGDAEGRTPFLSSYGLLHTLPALPHAEVVEFVKAHRLQGKGLPGPMPNLQQVQEVPEEDRKRAAEQHCMEPPLTDRFNPVSGSWQQMRSMEVGRHRG